MKVYITTHVLTQGIRERVLLYLIGGNVAVFLENGEKNWVHRKNVGWHKTYEEARQYAETVRKKKIAKLKKAVFSESSRKV